MCVCVCVCDHGAAYFGGDVHEAVSLLEIFHCYSADRNQVNDTTKCCSILFACSLHKNLHCGGSAVVFT